MIRLKNQCEKFTYICIYKKCKIFVVDFNKKLVYNNEIY